MDWFSKLANIGKFYMDLSSLVRLTNCKLAKFYPPESLCAKRLRPDPSSTLNHLWIPRWVRNKFSKVNLKRAFNSEIYKTDLWIPRWVRNKFSKVNLKRAFNSEIYKTDSMKLYLILLRVAYFRNRIQMVNENFTGLLKVGGCWQW